MSDQSAAEFERPELKEKPFVFYGATRASLKHPARNEDTICYPEGKEEKDINWLAVFDGIGGQSMGDEASKLAAEIVSKKLSFFSPQSLAETQQRITEVFQDASKRILEGIPGSGTTGVVVKLVKANDNKDAIIGSVGDSRVYLFRNGILERITQDDSVIPAEVLEKIDDADDINQLSEWERSFFKDRNIVTQALGQAEKLDVHIYRRTLKSSDRLILTSDGVHDNLTRKEIEQIVAGSGDITQTLVKKARDRSQENHFRAHRDDMSAVVVEVK